MKKNRLNYMLIAILAVTMIIAFSACGGSDEESADSDGKTIHTEASTEVVSDYETVVYHYEDFEVPEDLYSSTLTIEYDGDKVMAVTQVTVDDMSAEDDDIVEMLMDDYELNLNDTGFKDMDGFTCNVDVKDKVRTETMKFDLTKFNVQTYRKYAELEGDSDYVSLDELVAAYEEVGYTKVEQPTEQEN